MSAIAFQPGKRTGSGPSRLRPLDISWAVFVVGMLAVMLAEPRIQTIPYHFIFVGFTLLYGFRLWSPPITGAMLLGITVVTGFLFLDIYLDGRVDVSELAEVPLMPTIVAVMAWHAWRRSVTQNRLEKLAALEISRLDRQRDFLRDASHAIRTPITIARGYVEVLGRTVSDTDRPDIDEVLHQLDRLHRLATRLLSIERLETAEQLLPARIEVADFVRSTQRRWSGRVLRRWRLDVRPSGLLRADAHRLEEALDALVENAVRFTRTSDVIRLGCFRDGGWVVLTVADSGPGVAEDELPRVFDRFYHRHPPGDEPGTGLGLALVRAVAEAHGGTARAARSALGGAAFTVRLPAGGRITSP
jgi:signal transduction histidine kinase